MKDEMGKTYSTYGRDGNSIQVFRISEGKDNLGDQMQT
jgi:hypothetical protein